MSRSTRSLVACLTIAASTFAGCELATSFDRSLIPSDAADAMPDATTAGDGGTEGVSPSMPLDAGSLDGGGTSACRPGDIDDSFGDGGIAFVVQAGSSVDVATQADGRILLLGALNGAITLVRLTPDGALDTSYGDGGFSASITGDTGNRLAVQADGRVVVTGAHGTVARYTQAGVLDDTFGEGGITATAYRLQSLALTPDGRILVAGSSDALHVFVALRYAADGTLDYTFGNGGVYKLPVEIPSLCSPINAVAAVYDAGATVLATFQSCGDGPLSDIELIQGDGTASRLGNNKLFTMAIAFDSTHGVLLGGFGLTRLAPPDLSIDQTFGDHGTAASPLNNTAQVLRVDDSGNILFAGGTGAIVLGRYLASGVLDPSFGDGGVVLSAFDGGTATSGADLRGCALSVTGSLPGFAVARYRACCTP